MPALSFDAREALAEIEKREETPAKTANPANFSSLSRFSRPTPAFSHPPDALDEPAAREERAAIVEFEGGASRPWAEEFAKLCCMARPPMISEDRWQRAIDDGGRFLDRWGAEAERLGWQAADVFDASPTAPAARYDLAGLALLVDGAEVVGIDADSAMIRRRTGTVLRWRRCSRPGAMPLWELV
jgi:hypothetical protein